MLPGGAEQADIEVLQDCGVGGGIEGDAQRAGTGGIDLEVVNVAAGGQLPDDLFVGAQGIGGCLGIVGFGFIAVNL